MSENVVRRLSKEYTSASAGMVREDAEYGGLTVSRSSSLAVFLEWKAHFPKAGKWYLHAHLSAGSSRPGVLTLNGVKQDEAVCGNTTTGWNVKDLQWFVYGPFDFKQGENVVRIDFANMMPTLKEIGFTPADEPSMEPVVDPQRHFYLQALVNGEWKGVHVLNQSAADNTKLIRHRGWGNRVKFVKSPHVADAYQILVEVGADWKGLHVKDQSANDGVGIIRNTGDGNTFQVVRNQQGTHHLMVQAHLNYTEWKGIHVRDQNANDGAEFIRHRDAGNAFRIIPAEPVVAPRPPVEAPKKHGLPEFPWQLIPNSGAVKSVTQLQDGTIVGVGLDDHHLYTRASLASPWVKVPNSGAPKAITQLQDGTLLCVGQFDPQLYTRASLTSPWVVVPNSNTVTSVTKLQDGTIVGIGDNHQLYTRASLTSPWKHVPNSGSVKSATQLQDGTIVGVGLADNQLYTRAALDSPWVKVPNSGAVISIVQCADGSLLGVGVDHQLYIAEQPKKPAVQTPTDAEGEKARKGFEDKLAELSGKVTDLEEKLAKCGDCETKLAEHANAINEIRTAAAKCGDCETKLAEQAHAIQELRDKNAQQASTIAALTQQMAELTSRFEAAAKPAPAPEPVNEQPPKPPAKPDNLEIIEGVGPKIADALKKEGITTFKQLAAMDGAQIKAILSAAGIRAPSDPTTWPKQAQFAAEDKMDELQAYKATLTGGRIRP